jgi:hypothetical protein
VKTSILVSLIVSLSASATPVIGQLSSPAGSLPALRVYAWSANGRLVATATSPGQPIFHLNLTPGPYRFFVTPADPGVPLVYAGHTGCSGEDGVASCSRHGLTWVDVRGDQPVRVDVDDWRIDDAQAAQLDHALHRPEGAGDDDPSAGAPRFFEYPAAPLRRARALQLAGSDARTDERQRLDAALQAAHINFAGRSTVVQILCGPGCAVARIVDLETGRVTPIPSNADRAGTATCTEHLAYRRDSRLLRVTYDEPEGEPGEAYYVWDPETGRLRGIGTPPAGRCAPKADASR